MPILTLDQKIQAVQLHGLDPSQWSVSDDGSQLMNTPSVVQPPQQQAPTVQPPAVNPVPMHSTQPDIGPFGTAVKTAIHEAPAVAASGAGFGAGATVGAELGAFGGPLDPLTIPAGALIGGTAGALLAGKGVSSAQRTIEEKYQPEYLSQLQAAQSANPKSAEAGEVAALPLGGLTPNPKNVLRAGGALAKMALSDGGATPEEVANLVNVGAGTVIGGVQGYLNGDSAGGIAGQALTGAVFNDPNNPIGKRFGFHPVEQRPITDPEQYRQMLSRTAPETGETIVDPTPGVKSTSIPDVSSTSTGLPYGMGSTLKKRIPYMEQTDTQPSEVSTMEAEGGLSPDIAQQKTAQTLKAYNDSLQERAEQIAKEQAPAQIKQAVGAGTTPTSTPAVGKVEVPTPAEVNPKAPQQPQEDITKELVVYDKKYGGSGYGWKHPDGTLELLDDVAARSAIMTAGLKQGHTPDQIKFELDRLDSNIKNQDTNQKVLTPAAQQLLDQVTKLKDKYPNLDVTKITPEVLNAHAQQISALHGITDSPQPGLENQAGEPVKGTAFVGNQKSSINPDIADAGTQAHENFHHIFDVMPTEAKTQLVDATKPELDAYNQQRVQAGQKPFSDEEYLATQMGYKTVSRLLNGEGETPLKQWWNDFKSGVKVKWGASPTVDDLYRNNVYKLIHGKSQVAGAGIHAGAVVNQEDEKSPKFIGKQQDFSGKTAGFNMYNLREPITDETGKVLHSVGSTVSEGTLQKYGIPIPKNQEGDEGIQKNQSAYDLKKQKMAAYNSANRSKINDQMVANRASNTAQTQELRDSQQAQPRSAGVPPHTYPVDEKGYQPPTAAPERRTSSNMNEAEETVAAKTVTKRLNRLFYKNLPMTMHNQWNKEYLPELRDKALMELRTNGLDTPEQQLSRNESIASSAGRRAIEQFNNFTTQFKERHGHQTSLDTAGVEGTGIHDKVGHIPSPEITSKAKETGSPEATNVGKPDTKRVADIKQKAERAAKSATVGQAKELVRDMYEQALDNEDEKASAHYKSILDKLEPLDDKRPIDLMKLSDASKLMEEESGTKDIGEENKSELDTLKFQPGDEGLTKKIAENPDTTPSQKYNFLWLMPELDQARRHAGPTGEPLAKALQQLPTTRDQMYGKYTSKVLGMAEKMNEVDKKKVLQTMYREDSEGQNYRNLLSTDKQRSLYDTMRSALVEKQTDQQKAGQLVTDYDKSGKKFQRPAQVNPNYTPSIMRADVIEQILDRTPKGKDYEQQLLKYWKDQGASDEYAKKRLSQLKSMEDSTQKNETRFGANRMTEGMGLPPELRVNDFSKMASRYFSKVSTDRAWHDTVEKNTDAMEALKDEDVKHYYGGIVDKIKGEPFDKDTGTIKAWNRIFTSALLGPLTNIHIGMSTFFNPFNYVKGSELASVYIKGMSHLGESAQSAIENGYKKRDLNTIHDIIDSQNTFLQKAGAVSSLIGKVNGREFTDKVAKTFAQAIGEEIVPLRIANAKDGDEWSQKMMKQLDANWTPDKVYSKQEVSQLASVLGGMIHGSHDYRTLPELMNRESVVKPFISLMSWSVAQTNQWIKHVWEPATTGNLQPLIMSTLGAAVGGYVIQQMRQAVTDKKSSIPSLTEIANSSRGVEGNIPLLAYNFMQMASYTGWMGLGSTIGKIGFDTAYKNIPQGATFPLDEAVTSIGSTLNEAVSAWLQTPNADSFFQIFPKALLDMGKENWQLARIATNWAADYGATGESETYKKEVNTGTQDLRRYKITEGQPYDQQTESTQNPYLNMSQKGFKRTTDLGKAAGDIPGLMQQAAQRANGNPEVFKSQLEGLKQNSFQTMPSPETMPGQFMKYYNYLTRTIGPEAAQQRMQEYMMHSAINRMKASMVP